MLISNLQQITDDMEELLQKLKTKCRVGLVGGSDLNKINEQMCATGEHGNFIDLIYINVALYQ